MRQHNPKKRYAGAWHDGRECFVVPRLQRDEGADDKQPAVRSTPLAERGFPCPEHKCTNCQGTLEPKGYNRNDCPRLQTSIWDESGETGHSVNKCPNCLCFVILEPVATGKHSALELAIMKTRCGTLVPQIGPHIQTPRAKQDGYRPPV
jgi:hypothetical protein